MYMEDLLQYSNNLRVFTEIGSLTTFEFTLGITTKATCAK